MANEEAVQVQAVYRQCTEDVPRTLGEGKADYAAGNVGTDR